VQSPPKNTSVLVLGAGLTGMSAALDLLRRGVDFALFESKSLVGGLAVTSTEGPYRFDHTGHLLHLRDAERRERTLKLLDDAPLEIHRNSFIFSEGVFTKYPYQSNTFGLPPDTAFECVFDFVQAFYQNPKPDAENFEDFCRIHFGNAISDRFMLPYNGRLWGVPPKEVTTEWCDRFVPRPSLEDVLAGAVGKPHKELGYNAVGFYPQYGIGELTQAMGRRIPSLHTNSPVCRIEPSKKLCHFGTASTSYRTLISTLPLTKLVPLIDNVPAPIAQATKELRCSSLYYLDVALRRRPKHHFHWIYVPESRFDFYRVGNYAAFSEAMAPLHAANLYVELVGRSKPDLSYLWPRVAKGLIEMGIIETVDDVEFYRLRHIEHAYVIYDQKRRQSLPQIVDYLAQIGVISTGRYGGWNYSSMEDALRFGEDAVAKAVEQLT
jgi:protoporphyrinogen oxidase